MGTNQNGNKWYIPVMEACFGSEGNLAEVTFLALFAAPMCMPYNANYDLPGEKRSSGPSNGAQKRTEAVIRQAQEQCLETYSCTVEQWHPSDPTVKQRMEWLADSLLEPYKKEDRAYAKKNSNYKSRRYLKLYLNGDEPSPEAMFQTVCQLYGKIISKLFSGLTERLTQPLEKTRELLHSKAPRCVLEPAGSDAEKLGQYLGALLLLYAAEGQKAPGLPGLIHRLLGIEPPEAGATLSVLSLTDVPLKAGQFYLLCTAALQTHLDMEGLRTVFQLLSWIYRKVDGHLDMETRSLVQLYMQALRSFCQRLHEESTRNFPDNALQLEQINEASRIYTQCQQWLEGR